MGCQPLIKIVNCSRETDTLARVLSFVLAPRKVPVPEIIAAGHMVIHTRVGCGVQHPYNPTSLHPYIPTSLHPYIPTSLHPYIPTSLHPYIPTSLHPYIPTSLHPYIPTSLHPYISTSLHPYIPTSLHPYIPTSLHPYSGQMDGSLECYLQEHGL